MSRYIDADEIEDFISRWGGNSSAEDCLEWIKNSPTADVRENVRGEWQDYEDHEFIYHICSICGYESVDQTKYCPKCGAEMLGGEL